MPRAQRERVALGELLQQHLAAGVAEGHFQRIAPGVQCHLDRDAAVLQPAWRSPSVISTGAAGSPRRQQRHAALLQVLHEPRAHAQAVFAPRLDPHGLAVHAVEQRVAVPFKKLHTIASCLVVSAADAPRPQPPLFLPLFYHFRPPVVNRGNYIMYAARRHNFTSAPAAGLPAGSEPAPRRGGMNTGPQDRTPTAAGAARAGTLAGCLRKAPPASRAAEMQLLGKRAAKRAENRRRKIYPSPS